GLYYYGYRWCAPNLQRWLNRDPIGEWAGINLYTFTGNNPNDFFDSPGLQRGQGTWNSGSINMPQFGSGYLVAGGYAPVRPQGPGSLLPQHRPLGGLEEPTRLHGVLEGLLERYDLLPQETPTHRPSGFRCRGVYSTTGHYLYLQAGYVPPYRPPRPGAHYNSPSPFAQNAPPTTLIVQVQRTQ
ncbi:MAG: hypothetical protein KJ070_24760, partial [Verrucomicrobia bacterium]|nr:hypothetical protein [Verrucomicrobiota bacterium]